MQVSTDITAGAAKREQGTDRTERDLLSAFPKNPVRLKTHSGFEFLVRPVRPDDRQGLAFLLTHMSPEDMRFRFLTPAHRISNNVLEMMSRVDHERVENILAVDRDTHIPIASLLLAADVKMQDVEVAMAVQAHYKGKGLSWTLLEYAIDRLRAAGFERLQSIELREHDAAITLEKEQGFVSSPFPDDPGLTLLELDLRHL